jgi:hypothetical protein
MQRQWLVDLMNYDLGMMWKEAIILICATEGQKNPSNDCWCLGGDSSP